MRLNFMNNGTRLSFLVILSRRLRHLMKCGWPRRLIIISILSLMMGLLAYVMFAERINIYTVSAKTDILKVTLASNGINQWEIPEHAEIIDFFAAEQVPLTGSENYVHVAAGTQVTMTIDHNNERLVITLENNSENGSVGELESNFSYVPLGQYVDIIFNEPQQLIFPFRGAMILGDDVAAGVDAVLREGTIRIIEQELLGDVRYISGEFQLDEGDRVTLHKDFNYEQDVILRGFVRYQPGEPMAVTAHGETTVARVERMGSTGYDAKTSMWKRFANDPVVIAMTSLYAVLFLMLEMLVLLRNIFGTEKTSA